MDTSEFLTPVFIAKLIDFVIFVAALVWMWYRIGKPTLVKAQDAQNKAIDDAIARKSAAEEAVARAHDAFDGAQTVAVKMIETAGVQAAASLDREKAAAAERASRMVAHARGELERERYRVRRELLEDTVDQAYVKAKSLIVQELDQAKQHALIDRLVADLERLRA